MELYDDDINTLENFKNEVMSWFYQISPNEFN